MAMIPRQTFERVVPWATLVVTLGLTTTHEHHERSHMLTHHIVRLQLLQVGAGPAIGVAEAASAKSPPDRLRHLLPPDRIPAHTPLMLLWRGAQLSSPDTIAVECPNKSGQRIDLQVELRRFDGTLHMNTVTVPIVEVDLGALEPGRYEVLIEVIELWFREYGHPENATNASTQHTSFSFVVV
jgi:hypothetical protein